MKKHAKIRWRGVAALVLTATACGGSRASVADGLSQRQANDLAVALGFAGITEVNHERAAEGERAWRVIVPALQQDRARRAISRGRLLPQENEELPELGGLFSERADKERIHAYYQARKLSETLAGLPGVYRASVHLAVPSRGVTVRPQDEELRATASVVIVTWPPSATDPSAQLSVAEEEVARHVAHAVERLDPSDVEIVCVALPEALPAETLATPTSETLADDGDAFTMAHLVSAAPAARAVAGAVVGIVLIAVGASALRGRRGQRTARTGEGGRSAAVGLKAAEIGGHAAS